MNVRTLLNNVMACTTDLKSSLCTKHWPLGGILMVLMVLITKNPRWICGQPQDHDDECDVPLQ